MNRIVLITGASRGLGLALVQKFLAQGDTVIGVSKTRHHWKTALKSASSTERFFLHECDLTKESSAKTLLRTVLKKHRRLDILINNAGFAGPLKRVEKTSLRDMQDHFSRNLLTALWMCKYALPLFQKRRAGLIINISSMAGVRAVPRLFAYSASKFTLHALGECIAKENQEAGIRCFTVCPGGMNTQMRADLFGIKDARKQQTPETVASFILDAVDGRIPLESGSELIIRYGKVTGINPLPGK